MYSNCYRNDSYTLVGFVLCITAFHLDSTPVRQLLCVSVFTEGKVLTETWGGACLRLPRCLLLIAFSLTLELILLFIIVWCYLCACYIVPAIMVWLLCLQVNNWQLPLMAASLSLAAQLAVCTWLCFCWFSLFPEPDEMIQSWKRTLHAVRAAGEH